MRMRSAANVFSTSSMASSGSLSPVSPAADTPSAPSCSTLRRRTSSARVIASSASDSQNRSALSCSAGATTITSALGGIGVTRQRLA